MPTPVFPVMAMQLYHNNMSVCAQKVRLVLHEKQLPVDETHVDLRAGDQLRPDYLKINPKGMVPVLIDQGQVITESSIICEYLEEAYPQVSLRPANALLRARMRSWTMLPDAGLHRSCGVVSFAIAFRQQYLVKSPEEVKRLLDEKPDPVSRELMRQTIDHGLDAQPVTQHLLAYNNMLTQMSRQLAGGHWLVGDQYSLADVAMLPYVCRLEDLQLDWLWSGERAAIADWLVRCKQRPNYSGIKDYLDQKYLSLMTATGQAAKAQVATMLNL